MNPEEKLLLQESLRLAKENNEMLRKITARARRQSVYGFIKMLLIVVPLVAGYIYLQPFLDQAIRNYQSIQSFL